MWGVILALTPVIVGLLAISAVFSAAETALTGASRTRMHQLEREGDRERARVIGAVAALAGPQPLGVHQRVAGPLRKHALAREPRPGVGERDVRLVTIAAVSHAAPLARSGRAPGR
jgi:hypothetical protein